MAERTCIYDGCPNVVVARGWCQKHYARWWRKGGVGNRYGPAAERFWLNVDKKGPLSEYRPDLGPCWLWTASIYVATGYGQFEGTTAHRWIWIAERGQIAAGLHLDHLCRVRHCVNFEQHLEVVTPGENLRRGAGMGGVLRAPLTHCRQGHPFVEGSYFIDKAGCRRCFACHYAAQARYRAKRRATF